GGPQPGAAVGQDGRGEVQGAGGEDVQVTGPAAPGQPRGGDDARQRPRPLPRRPEEEMTRAGRTSALFRRALVLAALLFWYGGATFYAAVAIPVGLSVLRPRSYQTFVTQAVTNYLNLAGAAALALFAWDLLAGPDPRPAWRRWRWGAWGGMAATLLAMLW